MKIAIILYSLSVKGGGPRQMLELANNLEKKGWDVTVYTVEYNKEECYPELCKNLRIRSLENNITYHAQNYSFKEQLSNFIHIVKLGILLAQEDYDVLHPHEWPANWAAAIAKVLRVKNIRTVWMCNDLWHVYNPFSAKESRMYKIRRGIDIFLTNHFINAIVVLDNRMKKLAEKYYRLPVYVVRSGIDSKKYFIQFKHSKLKVTLLRQKLGVDTNDYFILSLSVFYPQRRFEDAVLAVKNLVDLKKIKHNFTYVIVGSNRADPNYFHKIKKIIQENNLEKYIKLITDPVSETDLLEYYDACDIFIFPNDKQTWGLATIEAMAMGKPCIVSKGAGVHEVLIDGANALLVQPRKPEDIAKKMLFLLQNPKRMKEIGINAKKFVINTFSWKRYTEDMITVIKNYE